ncbi:hypothetical protein [Persephonella sp.]
MPKVIRLRIEDFTEAYKCPICNYNISSFVYFLSDSKEEVEEKIKAYLESPEEHFDNAPICSDCLSDLLAEGRYTVSKEFDETDYPNTYFADYYSKENIEQMIGFSLTDEQWQELKSWLENSGITDEVSGIVLDEIYKSPVYLELLEGSRCG